MARCRLGGGDKRYVVLRRRQSTRQNSKGDERSKNRYACGDLHGEYGALLLKLKCPFESRPMWQVPGVRIWMICEAVQRQAGCLKVKCKLQRKADALESPSEEVREREACLSLERG